MTIELIHGDARHLPLADGSVQCIVTSPPYWGLRKYAGEQELIWGGHPKIDFGSLAKIPCDHEWQTAERAGISGGQNQGDKSDNPGGATNQPVPPSESSTCRRCGAWRGAYGLEPTIEMYVAHTVEILRECRRVLRPDGVLFWNIGDSYARDANKGQHKPGDAGKQNYIIQNGGGRAANEVHLQSESKGSSDGFVGRGDRAPVRNHGDGLKSKDLCLMPSRVALAAQGDGWWVRSMIIWAKPNPMPESVTDRPTDAYEHILMLTKSERYYWDADAVREPLQQSSLDRGYTKAYMDGIETAPKMRDAPDEVRAKANWRSNPYIPAGRNLRNIWNFPTQPYSGAHFATFPEELPRRCILAATSARGACAQCGAPWERVTRPSTDYAVKLGKNLGNDHDVEMTEGKAAGFGEPRICADYETIGWRPTCLCPGQHGKTAPCVVLDPFGGSGTTGRVALELRRRAVLLDIAYNAEYRELAERRTSGVNVKLPFL